MPPKGPPGSDLSVSELLTALEWKIGQHDKYACIPIGVPFLLSDIWLDRLTFNDVNRLPTTK